MKIQCSCGAKYSFDLTPEMARAPITFVCQNCGVDSSEMVNRLIAQQQAESSAPPLVPPPRATEPIVVHIHRGGSAPAPEAAGEALPSVSAAPVRVSAPAEVTGAGATPAVAAPQICLKHIGQLTTHRCLLCQKPICPRCMELFGYVCSALCKAKAETQGIQLPVYENQKTAVEAR